MGTNPNQNDSAARSLLSRLNKEIKSIPDYKGSVTGKPAEAPLQMIAHSITAARRAVRFLKGKPSLASLVKKRNSLLRIIKDGEELREMDFDGKASGGMGRSMTTMSKSQMRAKQQKARERGQ